MFQRISATGFANQVLLRQVPRLPLAHRAASALQISGKRTPPNLKGQKILPSTRGSVSAAVNTALNVHKQSPILSPFARREPYPSIDSTSARTQSANVALHIRDKQDHLEILWSDGHVSTFHYIWLRDNCRCPECFHPAAKERMLDTHSLTLCLRPEAFFVKEKELRIIWPAQGGPAHGHEGVLPLEWLRSHCYSPASLPATGRGKEKKDIFVWRTKDIQEEGMPLVQYEEIMASDEGVLGWLETLNSYGFCIVDNVPQTSKRCEDVARRISYLRTTFWGDTWAVKSEPNPKNLSLTGSELHPHTDFAWAETPPGLQFLHCQKFTGPRTVGGESTLVDGFAVAEHIRETDPTVFALLSNVKLPFQFQSDTHNYFYHDVVFNLDRAGAVQNVRFNQANLAPLDIAPELVIPMYRALHLLTASLRDARFLLSFRLEEGQMLIFNNRRMLHGRKGYDPRQTDRHLEGCYLDEDEFLSRLTLLRKAFNPPSTRPSSSFLQEAPFSSDWQERERSMVLSSQEREGIEWRTLPSGAVVPSWSIPPPSIVTRTHPARTRPRPTEGGT